MLIIIFVGGIHGVGKTYFCKKIATELNMKHYSSSDLIFEQTNENPSKNKQVNSPNSNQELLIKAVKNIYKTKTTFLLDGHCCLLNKCGDIEKISLHTFEKLNPRAMIVMIDSIDSISQRLLQRDTLKYDYLLLSNFQELELAYSKVISKHLEIPLFIYDPTIPVEKVTPFILTLNKN